MRLRIGSRGSQLALWQANHVAGRLREHGHEVEIKVVHTTGDKILDVSLAKVGTKGMFTKEIEDALAEEQIDLAVHSLKDLPTELAAQFEIAAIPEREDPRDALCSKDYPSVKGSTPGDTAGPDNSSSSRKCRHTFTQACVRRIRRNHSRAFWLATPC